MHCASRSRRRIARSNAFPSSARCELLGNAFERAIRRRNGSRNEFLTLRGRSVRNALREPLRRRIAWILEARPGHAQSMFGAVHGMFRAMRV
eukprot:7195630-Lingulodinium_polyedra.AAC.1